MTPHRCPVCYGYGTVSKPPEVAGDQTVWVDNRNYIGTCPACKGACIVWEPNEAILKGEGE